MKNIIRLCFLMTIFMSFFNCKPKEEEPTIEEDFIVLTIIQDNLSLFDKAGEEGNLILQIPLDTDVSYLNEISDFTTELTFKNIALNDPWLKVRLADGQEGWLYAGGVKFDTKGEGQELAQMVINKRLAHFFGQQNGQMIEQYQQLFNNTETALEFFEMYRLGSDLKDSLNIKLNQIDISENQEIPDLFWMREPLPAMLPMDIDSGAVFYLFFNYGELLTKASETIGEEDDEFIELFTMIYTDSIEYLYPSWHLRTSPISGNSLFGENKHIQILEQLDKIISHSDLFDLSVQNIKTDILNDIFAENHYWHPKEKLLVELEKVIEADFECLSKDEKIALQERMKMFETPSKYEIYVNQRDGE